MTTPSLSTAYTIAYPENIYTRISDLNRILPNIQKWALISNAIVRTDGKPYDPAQNYDLQKFVCDKNATYNLGQIHELRQVLTIFYTQIRKDPEILSTFAGDTSKYMAELINDFCKHGYTYRYTDPKQPQCKCYMIYYRDDERPPTCSECHGYEEPPVTDETTDEHFHVIPFPQRNHMNFPLFIWVLAFMLEGYEYEFVEYEPNHVVWNRDSTHQYFKFYAKFINPSKKQLRGYQEYRRLYGEYFIETPKRPKPTPVSPSIKRFPNFPRRHDPSDEPQWWEL
jgi:hypothetical protein